MSYFKNAQEVYEHLGRLMEDVVGDEELGPRFCRANTTLRQELHAPESVITVRFPREARGDVEFGDSAGEAEVTISMDADVAHRFWLGELNLGVALARGQVRATGPIDKILRLVPLTRSAYERYRSQLIAQGREDLVEV